MHGTLEICCASAADAAAAQASGADRIELNSALSAGGLTPSPASFFLAKKSLSIPVLCMIRPREQGFCYSEEETRQMMEDAEFFLRQGADGVVFGFLTEEGRIDRERTEKMCRLAHSFRRTAVFHRAFDCAQDPLQSMEELIVCGVDRVLTSGQKSTAWEGKELLKTLQARFGSRIQILPGSGINAQNAAQLLAYTGLTQCHASAKAFWNDPTTSRGSVSFSVHGGACWRVDAKAVRRLAEVVHSAGK